MIIDFHAHIFPEALAAKTLPWMMSFTGIQYQTNGTGEELRASMDRCGVDMSVTLPIVTRVGTMRKINDYAAEQAKKWGFMSFGSVHPGEPDWKGELRRFGELGLKGLKLHHDYQDFWFDSKENYAIIEYAFELGLPVLVHPCSDPVSTTIHRCTPKMLRDAMPLLTQGTFIAAHLGGHMMIDEARSIVIGQDVYIDVSMAEVYYPLERIRPLLLEHNPDKILFGTDSPWDDQKKAIDGIRSMALGEDLESKILGENARKILGI